MKTFTSQAQTAKTDLVINFHMTESCNYKCSYCYATWEDLEAKNELHRLSGQVEFLLQRLAEYFLQPNALQAQMGYQNVRLNFAGGEPMLLGQRFVDAVKFANRLGFRTSLITNGHYLTDDILDELALFLDVLGISYDTADYTLAQGIGRIDRKKRGISSEQLIQMCARYRCLNPTGVLKLNTVVNAINCGDSLLDLVSEIQPNKWKLLRVLPVHDHQLTITQAAYRAYVQRHAALSAIIVEEDNDAMTHTYLMINPEGRFYQNSDAGCGYIVSDPILTVGVEQALSQVPFDVSGFKQRYQLIPTVALQEDVMTTQLIVLDGIPKHIEKKAWQEIDLLKADENRLHKWKMLRCDRGLYRFKLNAGYRLVVAKENTQTGPYEVMTHARFDKKYK